MECSQVVRHDRILLGLLQTHPRFRDDHESEKQRLSSGMLRLPALQSEVGDTRWPSSDVQDSSFLKSGRNRNLIV